MPPRRANAARTHKRLETALDALARDELVRAAPSAGDQYTFKHALLQDVTYSSLLLRDRQTLHRDVARAYETLGAGRPPEELAALLAEHYAAAGDDARTLEFALSAANAALRVYALHEAILNYARARAAAIRLKNVPPSVLLELYTRRGRALFSHGEWQAAWENYLELEQLALTRADLALELASLIEQLTLRTVFNPLFDPVDGLRLADRAVTRADELGDRAARSRILWNRMRLTVNSGGDAAQAVRFGEEALALARALGLTEQAAYALGDLQYAYRAAGRMPEAEASLAQARAVWQELGHWHMLADNLNQSASLRMALGDLETATGFSRQALELSIQSDNGSQQILSLVTLSVLFFEKGDMGQAVAYSQGAEALEQFWHMGPSTFQQARLLSEFGLYGPAIQLLRGDIRTMLDSPLGAFFADYYYALLARVLLRDGQVAEARAAADHIQTENPLGESVVVVGGGDPLSFVFAELAAAGGDYMAAVTHLDKTIAALEPLGLIRPLPQAFLLQGRAYLAAHDLERASVALERGRAYAEQMGMRRILWQIAAAQSEVYTRIGNADAAARANACARGLLAYIATHGMALPASTGPLPASPARGVRISPSDSMRRSFLRSPTVRAFLNVSPPARHSPSSPPLP